MPRKGIAVPLDALARRYWTTHKVWDAWIAGLALVAIAVVWVVTLERVQHENAFTLRDAEKQNSNLAVALEEHTDRTLKAVDQALAQVAREYRVEGKQLDLRELIDVGAIDGGLLRNFGVADADGKVILSTIPLAAAGVILGDWDFFRARLRAGNGMVIGAPLPGSGSARATTTSAPHWPLP